MQRKIFWLASVFVLSAMLVLSLEHVQAQITGFIPVFVDEAGTEDASVIFQTPDGNIGIGTPTPAAKLQVVGGDIFLGNVMNPASPGFSSLYFVNGVGGFTGDQFNSFRINAGRPGTPEDNLFIVGFSGQGATVGAGIQFLTGPAGLGQVQRMAITPNGNVGIGTTAPAQRLDVNGGIRTSGDAPNFQGISNVNLVSEGNNTGNVGFWTTSGGILQERMVIVNNGNVGIGTTNPSSKLSIDGNEPAHPNGVSILLFNNAGGNTNGWALGTGGSVVPADAFSIADSNAYRLIINGAGNVGIGTTSPAAKLDVAGTTRTSVLQITGGADLSEQFEVRGAQNSTRDALKRIEAGMVVAIDPQNAGKLVVSSQAYNRRVAGIISGAGNIKPGMLMGQSGSVADGEHPVALTGRVYAWADASNGRIEPGDLLTTSNIPGHAMKVTDYAKAPGAVLGKAMTGLSKGRGLVLVLVTLQ